MKAIVIGGGIGGITAAIALERAGIEAHVFERASVLSEVGAGISLWSNAIDALSVLGLGEAVRACGWSEIHTDLRTWRGAVLSGSSAEQLAGDGIAVGLVHRADLLAMLVKQVDPARIHLGRECVAFDQDTNSVTAKFANGDTASGDLLIGADGLRSVVRAQLFGDALPRYAGYTGWRAVVRFTNSPLIACETWGCGRRFGVMPMRGGKVYWYATQNAPEGGRDASGEVKQSLLRMFSGWHNSIEALIAATEESAILRNDIYDREPLPRWTEKRAALLGDAAHPMTPNLGQGACQAIEDAVVLAACLKASSGVVAALEEYENRRRPRTDRIVLLSRRIGEVSQWGNPIACFARNTMLRAMPASAAARQMKSIVRYDALEGKRTRALGL